MPRQPRRLAMECKRMLHNFIVICLPYPETVEAISKGKSQDGGSEGKTIMMHLNFMSRNICILFHHPNALGAKFFHLYSQAWHNSNKHDFKTFFFLLLQPLFRAEGRRRGMIDGSCHPRGAHQPSSSLSSETSMHDIGDATFTCPDLISTTKLAVVERRLRSESPQITGQNCHRLSGFWARQKGRSLSIFQHFRVFISWRRLADDRDGNEEQISSRRT